MDTNAPEEATIEELDDSQRRGDAVEPPIDVFDQLLQDVTASANPEPSPPAEQIEAEAQEPVSTSKDLLALPPVNVDEEALQAQADEAMGVYSGAVDLPEEYDLDPAQEPGIVAVAPIEPVTRFEEPVIEQAGGPAPGHAEPAPEPAVVAATPTAPFADKSPAQETLPKKRSFWQGFGLVLLGGLAGVLLTLIAAIIWSGTVDFAPRRQVEALSSNVSTMQSNQELAWERLDGLDLGAGELARRTGRAEATLDTVVADVATTEERVDSTEKELSALQEQLTEATTEFGDRMDSVETSIESVSGQVSEITETVGQVEGHIERFNQFFDALGDLIGAMRGE